MMVEWTQLHKRFLALSTKVEPTKTSSFSLGIEFNLEQDIMIRMGTYDIGGWNRHTYLGPFSSEEEAYAATLLKIEEAEKIVQEELAAKEVYAFFVSGPPVPGENAKIIFSHPGPITNE